MSRQVKTRSTLAVLSAAILAALVLVSLPVTETAATAPLAFPEDAGAELLLLEAGSITSAGGDCNMCLTRKGSCPGVGSPELCGTIGQLCLCSYCGGDYGCYTQL